VNQTHEVPTNKWVDIPLPAKFDLYRRDPQHRMWWIHTKPSPLTNHLQARYLPYPSMKAILRIVK
jgi:hypothetical protein